MRKFFLIVSIFFIGIAAKAQTDSTVKPKGLTPGNLPRSNDHFLLQVGYTLWNGKPASINTTGVPRTFNAYFLFDFPFKTNPHWSAAIGAGIGTDNIYFDKTNVGIKDQTSTLIFDDRSDTVHFKKYKLATTYAEAPIELRYRSRPDDDGKAVKVAIGVKVGMLINAHVKGNTLEDKSDNTINNYKMKEYSKNFFNKNRVAGTARIGYGHFSLFGTYSLTTLFKEGLGPTVRPLTIGLTLSGL
ncbi:MAG TPA: outer membrane beta-barrel protein [Chitinophagaceae bacterium]|jgi:hypothetical protein|nr:outer membrane beta-barrel protein [Chitinophagaceae bacterium]